jgi:hypothetical protein
VFSSSSHPSIKSTKIQLQFLSLHIFFIITFNICIFMFLLLSFFYFFYFFSLFFIFLFFSLISLIFVNVFFIYIPCLIIYSYTVTDLFILLSIFPILLLLLSCVGLCVMMKIV